MSASQNALRQTESEPDDEPSRYDYLRDGGAIYARSFAMIRAEADLARWSGAAERVVVRMIHACGMTDLPADVEMSRDVRRGRRRGAPGRRADPVRCADGGRRRHPGAAAGRERGDLHARRPARAGSGRRDWAPPARPPRWSCGASTCRAASSRSATRRPRCSACSNCSTRACAPPAAVIGIPVGFVGAAESKEALARDGRVPFVVVHGRRGGSAMAAAAVNALASEVE